MKKTLVAVAAFMAATGAMAEVTIFGIVDQSIVQSTTGAGVKTTTLAPAYTGNELGFKGSEDMGSGIKADFRIHFAPSIDGDNDGNTTAAGAPTAYQSWVGLTGEFGNVRLGRFFSPTFFNAVSYSAIGLAVARNTSADVGTGTWLNDNNLEYSIPSDIIPGLGLTIHKTFSEVASNATSTDITQGRIHYTAGAFSAGYSTANTAGTSTTVTNTLGASYNMGMATVMLKTLSSKVGTAAADTGNAIGVSVPFGASTIMVESSNGKVSGANTNSYHAMVKYDFSKRTSLILQTGQTSTTTTAKKSAVGLWHAF